MYSWWCFFLQPTVINKLYELWSSSQTNTMLLTAHRCIQMININENKSTKEKKGLIHCWSPNYELLPNQQEPEHLRTWNGSAPPSFPYFPPSSTPTKTHFHSSCPCPWYYPSPPASPCTPPRPHWFASKHLLATQWIRSVGKYLDLISIPQLIV